MWRLRPSVLAAAVWASVCIPLVRRRLRKHGVRATAPRPPKLPASAHIGVRAGLHRLGPTCLERALIMQSWLSDHGDHRDVIVGVPVGGMVGNTAHAWLEGSAPGPELSHREILRLPSGGWPAPKSKRA